MNLSGEVCGFEPVRGGIWVRGFIYGGGDPGIPPPLPPEFPPITVILNISYYDRSTCNNKYMWAEDLNF